VNHGRSLGSQPPAPLVGALLGGRFRIESVLGWGGMGIVYLARDHESGRSVAVKVLHGFLADDETALVRFERETQGLLAIDHPGIVRVVAVGAHDEAGPFLAMEHVTGDSLSQVISTEAPLPIPRACAITVAILDALGAAHAAGLVHRDLKPDNVIMVRRDDTTRGEGVKIFDFGIAALIGTRPDLTPTGRTMGTPAYTSPEQVREGSSRDPRVDIYATGVLLYEMLTGARPFSAPTLPELCDRIIADPPTPMAAFQRGIPTDLEQIAICALSKDPAQRFPEARSMAERLAPFTQPGAIVNRGHG